MHKAEVILLVILWFAIGVRIGFYYGYKKRDNELGTVKKSGVHLLRFR